MSEYGHAYSHGAGFHLDGWGVDDLTINADGQLFRFTDSDRFGPQKLKENGEPSNRDFRPRSPFWRAHYAWREQGRKVDDEGKCLYVPLKPNVPHLYITKGRTKIIVKTGWENGFDAPVFIDADDAFEPPTVGGEVL